MQYTQRSLAWRAALCLVLLAVVSALASTGVFSSWLPHKATIAFDESLLSNEPLQIGDLRSALNHAVVRADRGDWSIALRLIRDARNQWEAFLPAMKDIYKAYCWTEADIDLAALIWSDIVQQTELKNNVGMHQAVNHLLSIMDRYRQPLAS